MLGVNIGIPVPREPFRIVVGIEMSRVVAPTIIGIVNMLFVQTPIQILKDWFSCHCVSTRQRRRPR